MKLRATSCVPIDAKATSLIHTSEIKITRYTFKYFSIDIRKCEDIDHANVIFGRGPRATYMVLAGGGHRVGDPAL